MTSLGGLLRPEQMNPCARMLAVTRESLIGIANDVQDMIFLEDDEICKEHGRLIDHWAPAPSGNSNSWTAQADRRHQAKLMFRDWDYYCDEYGKFNIQKLGSGLAFTDFF